VALDRYLARAKPELVMIELASEFYVQSQRAPYAAQNIEIADIRRGWWSVLLALERHEKALPERLEAAGDRIRAMLARFLHVGIIRHARHDRTWTNPGYMPDDSRPESLSDDDIARALAAESGPAADNATALAFRRWQRDKLLALGINDVRFYVPPIADPMRRGWSEGLCAALAEQCMPMDPDFLRALPPRVWKDLGHLRPEGARLYAHWFAQRLNALQ
jgi:hypothetical protein